MITTSFAESRFECKQCGACCTWYKINTDKRDAGNILRAVGAGYVEKDGAEYKIKKNKGRCIFLENNLCKIHNVFISTCRFYPYYLSKLFNGGYRLEMSHSCPFFDSGKRVSKKRIKRIADEMIRYYGYNEEQALVNIDKLEKKLRDDITKSKNSVELYNRIVNEDLNFDIYEYVVPFTKYAIVLTKDLKKEIKKIGKESVEVNRRMDRYIKRFVREEARCGRTINLFPDMKKMAARLMIYDAYLRCMANYYIKQGFKEKEAVRRALFSEEMGRGTMMKWVNGL